MMPMHRTSTASFQAPRQVLVGPGASAELAATLQGWGVPPGPVLLVRDAVVAEHGLGAGLVTGLEAAGFAPHFFDSITAEPDLATAGAALDAARACAAVVVVGIGGGSSMDVAKVASAYARQSCTVEDVVAGTTSPVDALPLVLVPTTAGTGAETTRVSMVSVDGHKRILLSPHFVPLLAVLDADLVASLPPAVTASSGLDAMSHACEAFVSTNATSLTDATARAAVAMLATALPRAFADGTDQEARAMTLEAAHLAGRSLNAGVVLGHSIAYTIADRTHLPHGITTGMSLPFALAYSWPRVEDRLAGLAAALDGEVPASATETATGLVTWLARLATDLGAPASLAAVGIGEDSLADMAAECIRDYPRPNNPVPLEQGRLETLLGCFHRGDVLEAVAAMTG
jgi:alcohol dehydrogenase class IV